MGNLNALDVLKGKTNSPFYALYMYTSVPLLNANKQKLYSDMSIFFTLRTWPLNLIPETSLPFQIGKICVLLLKFLSTSE